MKLTKNIPSINIPIQKADGSMEWVWYMFFQWLSEQQNTPLEAGTGIDISDNKINNTGVLEVAEGTTDGTIAVDGVDVSVHGINSAAYHSDDDYVHKTNNITESINGLKTFTTRMTLRYGYTADYGHPLYRIVNTDIDLTGTGALTTKYSMWMVQGPTGLDLGYFRHAFWRASNNYNYSQVEVISCDPDPTHTGNNRMYASLSVGTNGVSRWAGLNYKPAADTTTNNHNLVTTDWANTTNEGSSFNNLVHISGTETITGNKIFNGYPVLRNDLTPSTNATKQSAIEDILLATSLNTGGIIDGASIIRNQRTNGTREVKYRAGFRKAGVVQNIWPAVCCGVYADDTSFIELDAAETRAKTPTNANDNTTRIATTAWVQTYTASVGWVTINTAQTITGDKEFTGETAVKKFTVRSVDGTGTEGGEIIFGSATGEVNAGKPMQIDRKNGAIRIFGQNSSGTTNILAEFDAQNNKTTINNGWLTTIMPNYPDGTDHYNTIIALKDSQGTTCGGFGQYYSAGGMHLTRFWTTKTWDNQAHYAMLQVGFNSNNDAFGLAPTPPTSSTGGEIATAEWCRRNMGFVVAFQAPTSANGWTWYVKYSNGWVRQGGVYTNNGQGENIGESNSHLISVNLLVAMADGGYIALYTVQGLWGMVWDETRGTSTLSFNVGNRSKTGAHRYMVKWCVEGMGAS